MSYVDMSIEDIAEAIQQVFIMFVGRVQSGDSHKLPKTVNADA